MFAQRQCMTYSKVQEVGTFPIILTHVCSLCGVSGHWNQICFQVLEQYRALSAQSKKRQGAETFGGQYHLESTILKFGNATDFQDAKHVQECDGRVAVIG